MQGKRRQATARAETPKGVDPRFAAIARLLARAAARQDFDKELQESQRRANLSDSGAKDGMS